MHKKSLLTKLAIQQIKSLSRIEIADIIKELILEYNIPIHDIPDLRPDLKNAMDDLSWKLAKQRLLDVETFKIKYGLKYNDPDMDIPFKLLKLQHNSCEGCIFLHCNKLQILGDLRFEWLCLYYNEYINAYGGSLPISAQHLPLCTGRYIDRNNPLRRYTFSEK